MKPSDDPKEKALDVFMAGWGKLFTAVLAEMPPEAQEAIIHALQLGRARLNVEFELAPLKMRAVITDLERKNEQVLMEMAGGYDRIHMVPVGKPN